MSNLTTEQMVVVTSVFQESYEHTLSQVLGDTRYPVLQFTAKIVLQNKAHMLVTEEGLLHAIALVFEHEAHRDFVFSLSFTFFSRLGEDEKHMHGLINNLARGVSTSSLVLPEVSLSDFNAMPTVLSARLATFFNAKQLLESNKWLVVLLLLQLCIAVVPDVTSKNH